MPQHQIINYSLRAVYYIETSGINALTTNLFTVQNELVIIIQKTCSNILFKMLLSENI